MKNSELVAKGEPPQITPIGESGWDEVEGGRREEKSMRGIKGSGIKPRSQNPESRVIVRNKRRWLESLR